MADRAEKARRQREIIDLVQRESIGSQEGLATALAAAGFDVTQSTLSRDLKELKVLRVPVAGGYRYLPAQDGGFGRGVDPGHRHLGTFASVEVTGVDCNETAVVVRTLVGRAQGVGVYIDGLGLPDLLATIAGDDTILVLPVSTRKTKALKKTLAGLFGIK
ncbi:MAG: arginine repressor [Deltaproteobacteria bacterium]|nr:arginine repressor [Deltaproteobacteria bacterium]